MRFCTSILAMAVLDGCLLLGGCSMVNTYEFERPDQQHPSSQASGSYFLAKHILQISIVAAGKGTSINVATIPVQDQKALMQLGFAHSPTSDDDIKVEYAGGLLSRIQAKAVDKTGEIFVEVARTIGFFRDGEAVPQNVVAVYEFDPFDRGEATRINDILRRRHRSCVEVELNDGEWSPGCGAESMGRAAERGFDTGEPLMTGPVASGIYYRRPLDRRVHIVQNGRTIQLRNYKFANRAPIFKIDIQRTAFVTRETTVTFKDGALESVAVKKESEALALAKLPLQIVTAFIAAPIDGLTKEKQVQTARAELLEAEAARIKSGVALDKARQDAGLPPLGAANYQSASAPSGQLRNGEVEMCWNSGIGNLGDCYTYLRN